jgi:hypothetical protein
VKRYCHCHFLLERSMRHRLLTSAGLVLVAWTSQAVPPEGRTADEKDQVLFSFADEATVKDWAPMKLPEVEGAQPAPTVEIVPEPRAKEDTRLAGKCLKVTFTGGDWPTVGTTRIPIPGNWQRFQTLKADLTVDRASVAYFRVYQGKPEDKPRQARWEKTMNLLPGRNRVTLLIRHGIGSMDPGKGDVSAFIVGMFRPDDPPTAAPSRAPTAAKCGLRPTATRRRQRYG